MKKQVKVKLKDIAEHLDLSVPTVSRALGGFKDISEATRTLVENTAREMDYRPNSHAKSLVTKKASIDNILILGVPSVLKSISFNSYYAEIIRAFCDVISTIRQPTYKVGIHAIKTLFCGNSLNNNINRM